MRVLINIMLMADVVTAVITYTLQAISPGHVH